ncbi:MAG: hypothetical protein U0164_20820 [Gemmatimonadaceae bacterium]
MRNVEKNRLQVLRRVRDFLQPMAEEPTLATAFAELESTIVRMTEEATRQDRHGREALMGTDSVGALAQALLNDLLRPVVHLVKTVTPDALTAGVPAAASLKLPRSRSVEGLITAARGFHDTAKPYEEKLVAAGLPKGHLARLLAGSDALSAAIDARARNVVQRSAAGTTTISEGKRAMRLLKLLDSLVMPLIRADEGKRKAWSVAKRSGRGRGGVGESLGEGSATAPVVVPVVTVAPSGAAVGVLSGDQTGAAGGAGEVAKAA